MIFAQKFEVIQFAISLLHFAIISDHLYHPVKFRYDETSI